ncbi:transposase [Escherichia coli]|uniref:Transposase n=1 Tax=Escherichia coli TaxID=562 RepID=A0A376W1P9_ECOLX|nr:transposase [Escherichia coli]
MKLYSRRMQIEQNSRDEKSERFGFGLRASYSCSAGRMLVLSLLATLSTIVLWLIGYHAENQGLHLIYQANSIKNAAGNLVSDVSGECLTTLPANFKTNGAKHHS